MSSPRQAFTIPWVFLSYSTRDDSVADVVRGYLEKQDIRVWQDKSHLLAGEVLLSQIGTAIAQVNYLVVLITRNSLNSSWVQKEMQLARRQGICILPLIWDSNLTQEELPPYLKKRLCINLLKDSAWKRIKSHLHAPCHALRVPMMADVMPDGFVERGRELADMKAVLLSDEETSPGVIGVALVGAGGFGKTWLARALCHNPEIQERFDEGILWITLGEQPTNLLSKVGELIHALTREGIPPGLDAARSRLWELLDNRAMLLVIDDVWRSEDLEPFLTGGQGSVRRLITTRNLQVLPMGVRLVKVGEMTEENALNLLAAGLPDSNPQIAARLQILAKSLGHWPLLLALTHGYLRNVVKGGMDLTQAIDQAEAQLRREGLDGFNLHHTKKRDKLATATLDLSLELLSDNERECLLVLAIFPEDIEIPVVMVRRLWWGWRGIDAHQSNELLHHFIGYSLLQRMDFKDGVVKLHDVVRFYLRNQLRDKLTKAQAVFLKSFKVNRWADLPLEETYLWRHLRGHLMEAGQSAVWLEALRDPAFIAAKAVAMGSGPVVEDLLAGVDQVPEDNQLAQLLRHFRPLAHRLGSCATRDEAITLLSAYQKEVLVAAQDVQPPCLSPLHLLPDTPPANLLAVLEGHEAEATNCVFSPDSLWVVSTSNDRTIRIWSAKTGQSLMTLEGHGDCVNACVFSPDGRRVMSASDDMTLRIWSADTGQTLLAMMGHTDGVTDCAFSPDGRRAVSASWDQTLRIWSAKSGETLLILEGHAFGVNACSFSPDGRLVVSASRDDTLRIWSAENGQTLRILAGHEAGVTDCAFSPDCQRVVSASDDRTLRIWSIDNGKTLLTLKGHEDEVTACTFSPDGRRVLSASLDKTLRIWSAESGQIIQIMTDHRNKAIDCSFSPDGKWVVSASGGKSINIWSADTEQSFINRRKHATNINDCSLSPNGQLMISASSDSTLCIWSVENGKSLLTLVGHTQWVNACAFSPDGKRVVSASFDKSLIVWSATSGKNILTMFGHMNEVLCCSFSPDGQLVLSGSVDNTLNIWSATNGKVIRALNGHNHWVTACSFRPDGQRVVSASYDKTLRIWSVASGQTLQILAGHSEPVHACAFSPDGQRVVSASGDRTLRIWSAEDGKTFMTLTGHGAVIKSCAFSPDGRRVLSASDDRTLRLWDARTGQCLHVFPVLHPLRGCAMSSDGQHVVACGDGGVYFLKLVES